MPRFTARERRDRYQREHDFQVRTGKPFFPGAILHDSITSLLTVALIIGMTILWHAQFHHPSSDPNTGRGGGILGPAYEDKADPGTDSYDPRPDWYFFFLFQLLRIIKNPDYLLFATVIIPTLLMILLISVPFIDRNPSRLVSRRPFAMATLTAVPVVLLYLTLQGSHAPAIGAASSHPGASYVSGPGGCGSCHAMKDAGIGGAVGPNWDSSKPTYALALDRITNGKGGMPKIKSIQNLNDNQVDCLSAYIATWSGSKDGKTPGPNFDAKVAATYKQACTAAGPLYKGDGTFPTPS